MQNNSSNRNFILAGIAGIAAFVAGIDHYRKFYDFVFKFTNSQGWTFFLIILSVAIVCFILYFLNHFVFKLKITRKGTLTPNDGIAHITYFWEKRKAASPELVDIFLRCTKYSKVFISGIGLGTVSEALMTDRVIGKFVDCMKENNSAFHMQIIFPAESSEEFRPETPLPKLKENIDNGHTAIKKLIQALKDRLPGGIPLSKHLLLSNYNSKPGDRNFVHKVIPRHFLLQIDDIIYVGPYLAQEEGKNSFLMRLEKPDKNIPKEGMYNIYLNEIDYLKYHSTESTKVII